MAFGVFIHRIDSNYDDKPTEQYQFPKRYLSIAKQCEGDWVVYFEPSRVKNSRGYFAVAKVQEIVPDTRDQDMFIAIIEPGTYLDFGDPVPFREEGSVVERGILNDKSELSGRAQFSVRILAPADFAIIVERGLARDQAIFPRPDHRVAKGGLAEPEQSFLDLFARDRIKRLTNRAVRDRNFRRVVLRAYNERCAITGLRLINGGGRAEVEAAHIRPVEHEGPDIVSNGIALSGTACWMFDRGLVGLTDDLKVLVSRQSNDPGAVWSLINNSGALLLPRRTSERPNVEFVAWHRGNRFKQ